MAADNPIFASDFEMEPGTVHIPKRMFGSLGEELEPQPIFIVRVATREEYQAQGEQFRGWPGTRFYYEVSTD